MTDRRANRPILFWDDPEALDLDESNPQELGLISPAASASRFGRQAAGYNCFPMDAYGYYTTLREQCPEIQEFYSGKDSIWKGWGATGLEDNYHANAEITASFFERVLAQYGLADVLRVKRDSKGSVECIMEAWVSVDILQISSNWPAGFQIGSGILTWPNSD